jgi:glycosyltransferase involved in cell wall biosynthesis
MSAVSIVVPTLNEANNIAVLVRRINTALRRSGIDYEIIFVDDRSTDTTVKEITALMQTYPVRLQIKAGEQGKSYSLLEGFAGARHDLVCMIDADLQYAPEEVPVMVRILEDTQADIVLSERSSDADTSRMRQVSSRLFNLVFARLLFGINYDTQSGLKVFKKDVLDQLALHPTPWSFDLEFIVRALEADYRIISHRITFSKRMYGQAKVRILRVAAELTRSAVRLRLTSSPFKIRRSYHRNLEPAES